MTDRPTLFDAQPGRTHRNDPWTSQHAAKAVGIRTGSLRRRVLEALAAEPDGLTDFELGDRVSARPTSAGTRRKELEEIGCVERTSRTRPSPYGNPSLVHIITAAGRAQLAATEQDTP